MNATAHDVEFCTPSSAHIEAEVVTLIALLADAQCRRRITDARMAGNIDGDSAMGKLVALDLIEFTPAP